jgi:hypothetical protein
VLDEDPDIAWYGDEDDDGWALSATPLYACEADGIYTLAAVSTELDCNDTDATLNHDDVDGDTVSTCDAAPDCVDRDADLSSAATDAGLSAADIFPGATETWYDGVDQDCAGDNDFDQDGDLQVPEAYASEAGSGYTSGDCDDDPTDDQGLPASLVFVGADELCDGFDNNCDGSTDEGAPKTVFIPDSGASFVLPTPDPGGTAPATITLTEPGALRWCADDRILASVDSDNVRLLGINGRHDNEGGATWLANRTGGKVDQVNLLGGFVAGLPDRTPPLVVEAGAEVNTAVGLDLRGEATIAGSWTATNVRLLTRSDTVDPDDPSPPEGDSGRVLVDAEGQLDGSYFTAFGLDRTPFTVFGYANISWLNARNNVGGDAGVIQVGNVLNRGAIVDLESVTMVGNEGTFAGAIDIGNGSNATLTGLSYLYDNLGTSIFVGYQATFTATDAEIAGRWLREDGTVGQGSLILSRGDVTLNNCLLSAQLHADVGVHVLQGSLAVNGGSFEDTWRQGVKLEGNASSDPSTLVLNNVNMFNVPAEDVPSYFCEGYEPECRDFSRQSHVYLERSTEPYRCDCEYQSRCYPLREQYWWGDSGDELSISANCNTDTGCTSDVTPVCPL